MLRSKAATVTTSRASYPLSPSPTYAEEERQLQPAMGPYICSPGYISSLVEKLIDLETVNYNTSDITVTVVQNDGVMADPGGPMYPSAPGLGFCNVSMTLSPINLHEPTGVMRVGAD